jgi:hypothetical protein
LIPLVDFSSYFDHKWGVGENGANQLNLFAFYSRRQKTLRNCGLVKLTAVEEDVFCCTEAISVVSHKGKCRIALSLSPLSSLFLV